MEFVYIPEEIDDVYEPFIVKIAGTEYKLQFPLTTEKIERFLQLSKEEREAIEKDDIKTQVEIPTRVLHEMLKIPMDVLEKMHDPAKREYVEALSAFIPAAQKKKTKTSK